MNKTKLLTVTVIILVLINLITLSFFISKGPHNQREQNNAPREIVIDKLHFDNEQIAQYDLLISTHVDSVALLDNIIKNDKITLYQQLPLADNQKVTDSLFLQIATTQAAIEKLHFNHFLAIKKLCKPDQLPDYNKLANELAKIFSKNLPPPPENLDRER